MGTVDVEVRARSFLERFNEGDLAGLLDLYEPSGCFVAGPGKVAVGLEAIRDALEAFLALKGNLHFHATSVVHADGLALVSNRWTLKGTGADGTPVSLEGTSAEVWRVQPDGTWRFAIDNPFGGNISA